MRSKILWILLLGLFLSANPQILNAQVVPPPLPPPPLFKITDPPAVPIKNFLDVANIGCNGTGSPNGRKYKVLILKLEPLPAVEAGSKQGTIVGWAWDASFVPNGGKWPSKPGTPVGGKTNYAIQLFEEDGVGGWIHRHTVAITIEKT